MKQATREKLIEAQRICDEENRSTEYMIQFMQDYAHVSFDAVMNFLSAQDAGREP